MAVVIGAWALSSMLSLPAVHNLRLSPMEKMGLQVVPPVKGSFAHTPHFGKHCLESLDSPWRRGDSK